ncbi:MAG TPA: hypothetical protein VEV38_04070, partial [Candidatus Eremiobacteraceae bacterium]|nr:hypothetical protein [Candidatus Eremiobacteraceae bacterium]
MDRSPAGHKIARVSLGRVLAFAIGVAIAVVAICLALLIGFAFPGTRALLVRSIGATYLSLKGFHLEHADIAMAGGVFDARDIVVTDGQRPFLDVAEVRVTYGERGRALGVSSVTIVKPQVFVHRSADGSYDVARLFGGGGSGGSSSGAPLRTTISVVDGSMYIVSDSAPTARVIELHSLDISADIDQGARSKGTASVLFGGKSAGSGLTANFDQNDIARVGRAQVVVRGAQLAPLIDVPVSSSAFVVEHGTADLRLDAYAVGWDPRVGPQWHVVGAGDVRDGALRTLPLAKPVTDIGGRLSVFDGTLEFENLRGSAGGVPLAAAGSLELFPDLSLGLRIGAQGRLESVRQLLPFSSKLPLDGDVALGVTVDGSPSSPHANITLRATKQIRYGDVPVDGFGLSAYYHDGHVALRSMAARYGRSTIGGDGDIDLTASPVAGQFVVVAHAPSQDLPIIADIDTKGTTGALVALDGPLMRLTGSGFASTTGGEQHLRAQVAAGPDGIAFSSQLDDHWGGELVALGELGHGGDAPAAVDVFAKRYHARLNGDAVALPGFTSQLIGWPKASGTIDGYAFARGPASMPGSSVQMTGDDVRFAGTSLGHVAIGARGNNGDLRVDRVAVDGPGIRLESAGVARIKPEGRTGIGIAAALTGSVHGDLGRVAVGDGVQGHVDGSFDAVAHGPIWLADVSATSPDRTVSLKGVPVSDVRAIVGGSGQQVVVYSASADVGGGHVDAQGTVPGRASGSLTVAVRGIDLSHQHAIALPVARGAVVAIGHVGGTAGSPAISGAASLVDGAYQGLPLAGDTGLAYRSGSLDVIGGRIVGAGSVAEVDGRVNGLLSGSPQVVLDADVDAADLGSLSDAFSTPASVGGIATGHFHASGALTDPRIAGAVDVGAGTVRGVGFTDLHAAIDASRGGVAVNDGGVTFGSSRIALSGSLSGSGTSLRASSAYVDLNDFNDFFDGKDVLEGHGSLDVAISNVAGDNAASGSFSLADASVSGVPLGMVDGQVSRAGSDLAIAMSQKGPVSSSDVDFLVPPQTGRQPTVAVRGAVQRLDVGALAPYVGLEDNRL